MLASIKWSLLNQVWYLRWLAFSPISGFALQLFLLIISQTSDYVYVALMRDLTLDKTLLAKSSFGWHANKGGVTIKSYWADNGRFADSGFQQAVKDCNQKITYWAVGAHHQNGTFEQRIKELTFDLERCFFTWSVTGQITLLQWCGHLLSKRQHIG